MREIDFRSTPLPDLVQLVQTRQLRASDLVTHALEVIAARNPELNAFVSIDPDRAMLAARDIDSRVGGGDPIGPLAGIPIGVKDTEDSLGLRTTFGSLLYVDRPPATTDCTLVARLKKAGAVVVGKTNTSEFAFSADTSNRAFGVTRNPFVPGHTAGGSSGGSAVAVAAGMVPLATGSDGGGSIRVPATICGLPGFKPSLGRVPHGDVEPPDWPTLSTRGLIATSVRSTAYAYDVVVGPDPRDLRSLPAELVNWHSQVAADRPLHIKSVAWSSDLGWADPDPEVLALCEQAVAAFAGRFGIQVEDSKPLLEHDPGLDWTVLATTGTMRRLTEVWGTDRWGLIDPGLAHLLQEYGRPSAARYLQAEDTCHRIVCNLAEIFESSDLLLCPLTARPAPGHAAARNGRWVQYPYMFNMARVPAGAVPVGETTEGVTVAVQIVGRQHHDLDVLRVMQSISSMRH